MGCQSTAMVYGMRCMKKKKYHRNNTHLFAETLRSGFLEKYILENLTPCSFINYSGQGRQSQVRGTETSDPCMATGSPGFGGRAKQQKLPTVQNGPPSGQMCRGMVL